MRDGLSVLYAYVHRNYPNINEYAKQTHKMLTQVSFLIISMEFSSSACEWWW